MRAPFIWSVIFALIAGFVLFLQAVFAGDIILNPILYSIGGIHIRWYGLIIALAIFIASGWLFKLVRQAKLSIQQTETLLWSSIVGGIIGARLIYVVQNISYYSHNIGDIINLTQGGLSIHGALGGGLLTAYWLSKKLKINFFPIADLAAMPVLLGMVIGRLGNFFNYELFGPPTDVPWKMFVPPIHRPEHLLQSEFFHPAFLYDMILNSIALAILHNNVTSLKFPGENLLRFFAAIAITRFIVEFWRLDERGAVLGGLTLAQLVSVVIFVITIGTLFHFRIRKTR